MTSSQGTGGSHGHLHARRQGLSLPCPRLAPLSAAQPRWSRHTGCTHTHAALLSGGSSAGSSTASEDPRRGTASTPPRALAQDGTGAAARCAGREPPPMGGMLARRRMRANLGAWNRPGPKSWEHVAPQRLCVAELVLALGRSLVPPSPDQAWGTGCIYIFVGYFALIKAVPALTPPAQLLEQAARQRGSCRHCQGQHSPCPAGRPRCAAAA